MTSPFRLLVRAAYRLMWKDAEKYGKCAVYGPEPFLATVRTAFHVVSQCDPILGERITSEPWIFIFTGKSSMLNARNRIYGINESWTKWEEYGVAVHLVQAGMIGTAEADGGHVDPSKPLRMTTEWIRRHDFPKQLVEFLEESQEEKLGRCYAQ